jgi:hypothetical protein
MPAERVGRAVMPAERAGRLTLLAALALVAACSGDDVTPPARPAPPALVALAFPTPLLPGSRLVATIAGAAPDTVFTLRLSHSSGARAVLEAAAGEPRVFVLTADDADTLGTGALSLSAVAVTTVAESAALPIDVVLARALDPTLTRITTGPVTFNERATLDGAGLLFPGEGRTVAHFRGTFAPDTGSALPIDALLPVVPESPTERARGGVVLTTDLASSLRTGDFAGDVTLESTPTGGATTTSTALPASYTFGPPLALGFEPASASLGQLLDVSGAGFLGGADRPDETTLLRLAGTFTPTGGTATAFGPVELVPEFVAGDRVRLIVTTAERSGELIAALFGARRGELAGTAEPVTIRGTEELSGAPASVRFTLGAPRQVVWLRFLPQFYELLPRFGLGSAAYGELESRVRERIQAIYLGWNLEVRLERPTDFAESGYAQVEIGGTDPNGAGLFGYDNSPGKDVGNLRLFDRLGGANAQTQADGYPGYGGVFVESLLYWSSHPELPGARPGTAPEPDPLFDTIFDPVRARPATPAEIAGSGDPARVAAVQRALSALASLIGETTAHELGHSLGLALPDGPPTAFHDPGDDPGCLMESGGSRPLGERAMEPGFPETHFCYDGPAYLDGILGE